MLPVQPNYNPESPPCLSLECNSPKDAIGSRASIGLLTIRLHNPHRIRTESDGDRLHNPQIVLPHPNVFNNPRLLIGVRKPIDFSFGVAAYCTPAGVNMIRVCSNILSEKARKLFLFTSCHELPRVDGGKSNASSNRCPEQPPQVLRPHSHILNSL